MEIIEFLQMGLTELSGDNGSTDYIFVAFIVLMISFITSEVMILGKVNLQIFLMTARAAIHLIFALYNSALIVAGSHYFELAIGTISVLVVSLGFLHGWVFKKWIFMFNPKNEDVGKFKL